jgi:protein-tyrosine phosphatase
MANQGPYRTSLDSPLRVDFLPREITKLPGGIGMTLAPGKKGAGLDRPWARDLTVDLACLRDTFRAKRVVTLMELDELQDLGIGDLRERGTALGLEMIHESIVDGGVPASLDVMVALVERILASARASETVVIHCKGGLGRTGTAAACCLVALGYEAARAIAIVRAARPGTVERAKQERFIEAFASAVSAPPP